MSSPTVVSSVDELRDAMLASDRVVIVGNQSKPPLWRKAANDAQMISTSGLSGVIEYEPSEFTITVWAGTPVSEISKILADEGQYLPFDPMLCFDGGATIGGTVASGLSGPGRFRYGGVRDFILGVQFLDGTGQLINSGGRVVKNAAGFDIPKFLVGSLGRYAAMAQMTFKVFPRPPHSTTFKINCDSHEQAAQRTSLAARERWELDALDYNSSAKSIFIRFRGNEKAIDMLAADVGDVLETNLKRLADEGAQEHWNRVNRFQFRDEAKDTEWVCKVLANTESIVEWAEWSDKYGANVYFSSAAAMAWISSDDDPREIWPETKSTKNALILKGPVDGECGYLFSCEESSMVEDVKNVFDPGDRFAD